MSEQEVKRSSAEVENEIDRELADDSQHRPIALSEQELKQVAGGGGAAGGIVAHKHRMKRGWEHQRQGDGMMFEQADDDQAILTDEELEQVVGGGRKPGASAGSGL